MEQLKQQVCAIPLEIGSKQQLQEGNNNYNEYTIIENGKKVLITHNQPIHYHLLIVSRHQSFMTWGGLYVIIVARRDLQKNKWFLFHFLSIARYEYRRNRILSTTIWTVSMFFFNCFYIYYFTDAEFESTMVIRGP